MYSKMSLEISSRIKILFQAVLTGYQIDNVGTITINDPPRLISSIGDTGCEIIRTYSLFLAHVTFVKTSDRISSINFVVGVKIWC